VQYDVLYALILLCFICTVEKRRYRYFGVYAPRVLSRKYTHRLFERAMCSLARHSHPVLGTLAGHPSEADTMVGEDTMSCVESRQWRHYTNPYIIIVRRHGKITQRGIRRFCVANGPCKLRTGFRGIVRVVIIFFTLLPAHPYPICRRVYVLNQQRIYSSPADDDNILRWNMRDKSKFPFTTVFVLTPYRLISTVESLHQGSPTHGNSFWNQSFKLNDIQKI